MKKTKPKETKTCKQCHNTYDISAFNNPVTKICMGCVRQAEAHNPAPKTIEDIKKMPHSTDQVLHIVEPPKCEHENAKET